MPLVAGHIHVMANSRGSAKAPFHPSNASALYNPSANVPMNYAYNYITGESSPSAFTGNPAASSSQASPSDLPDLYYDQDLPSSPSASSSNMICTPPLHWQTSWPSTNPKYEPHIIPPYLPLWQSPPLGSGRTIHPTVDPIDTDLNWMYQQQQADAEQPSIFFPAYDDYDPLHQSRPRSPSCSHAISGTQTLAFASPSSALSLSPLSDTVAPSALTLVPPASFPHPSRPKEPRDRVSGEVNGRSSKSYPPMARHHDSSNQFNTQSLYLPSHTYGPIFSLGPPSYPGTMTQCHCGCMGQYICQ
ncbi:hypothetical protein BDZ97DRAFT_1818602 [Flammula alnicola]|nr:hypothetical protein BDZ97DRAFT_1818602 [Flammula alnicola]